jgi:tRNA A-37 threonylcarbamoyl transferase component Bud32
MPGSPAHAAPLRVTPRVDRAGRGAVVELHPGTGIVLKEEPGTLIWRERLADGTEAVIKLYRRGLLSWCRCRLSNFRAWNEFRALRQLESLGERCTPPLFWGHGHFGSYGWGELLAMRRLPGCRPLADALASDPDAAGKIDLAPLWATVGRLHDAGLHHGTLLARNILVRGEGGALEFILLDLPRFHRFPYGIRRTRMARYDLMFLANTLLRVLPADSLPRWLTAYGMSDDQQAQFMAHLRRFRNSSRLRRVVGLEFNLRSLFARFRRPSAPRAPSRPDP